MFIELPVLGAMAVAIALIACMVGRNPLIGESEHMRRVLVEEGFQEFNH